MPKTKYSNAIFTNRFKKLFEADNIPYSQLENQTGVSQSLLNNYYNGKGFPTIENLIKIAQYYRVSTDYLLGLSENSTTDVTIQGISEYFGVSDKTVIGIKNNFDYINKRLYSKQELEELRTSYINDDFDIEFWNEYYEEGLKGIDEQAEIIKIIENAFSSSNVVLEEISKFILSNVINQDLDFYKNKSIISKLSLNIKEYSKADYLEYKQQKGLQQLFRDIANTINTLFTDEERSFILQSDNIDSLISKLGKWKSPHLNNVLGEDMKFYLKGELELMGLIDELKSKGK